MRLLLDTHVAVWAVAADPSLPSPWLEQIEDRANAVAVSVASLWEIAIKNSLDPRRAQRFGMSVEDAAASFDSASFALLPIQLSALREVERLPRRHGDPFDRLLVATAIGDDWRLLSHDRDLAAYGDRVILI